MISQLLFPYDRVLVVVRSHTGLPANWKDGERISKSKTKESKLSLFPPSVHGVTYKLIGSVSFREFPLVI